jgi:nucleotide-binding universal stress UspA family protein
MSLSETATTFRRVLVPLDGFPAAEAVLPSVLGLARALGLELTLLRVVPLATSASIEGARRVAVNPLEGPTREAGEYLEGVAARLRGDRLTVRTTVRPGDAVGEIVTAARETHADLIAMATHAAGGLRRLLAGSTADAVLRRADVPVFLVRWRETEAARRAA